MLQTKVQELLLPVVNSLGYDLWGCVYYAQGRHSVLRVYIDKPEGIFINDCEIVSKQVSSILDVENIITGQYTLEISSPGIPRLLLLKEHYAKYIGSQIEIKLNQLANKKLSAKIIAVNEDIIVLDVGDAQIDVQFSQIIKASLLG